MSVHVHVYIYKYIHIHLITLKNLNEHLQQKALKKKKTAQPPNLSTQIVFVHQGTRYFPTAPDPVVAAVKNVGLKND